MSNLTSNDVKGLMEAYTSVYDADLREKLEEENREIEELGIQIIENAAYVLFSQGYDVDDLLSYFREANTDTIVEDFVNFSEGYLILESVCVSEEYIENQFEILSERAGAALKSLQSFGAGAVNTIKNIAKPILQSKPKVTGIPKPGSAKVTGTPPSPTKVPPGKAKVTQSGTPTKPGSAKVTGATGTPPSSTKVPPGSAKITVSGEPKKGLLQKGGEWAKTQLMKIPGAKTAARIAKSPAGKFLGKVGGRVLPGIGVLSYGADAIDRAKKGDWGGAALSAAGAGLSAVPGVGLAAGLAPTAIQMATDAAGLTGDKSRKEKSSPEKQKWNASAAKGGKLAFDAGGGKKAMEGGGKTAAEVQRKGMEALRAREKTPNTAAGFDKAFASARELGQKAFKWRGKEYTTDLAHTNLFDVVDGGEYLGENQYEPYDIVLDYLFDNGHVDTLDEAHYVMLEMDAETIQSIVEEYQ